MLYQLMEGTHFKRRSLILNQSSTLMSLPIIFLFSRTGQECNVPIKNVDSLMFETYTKSLQVIFFALK